MDDDSPNSAEADSAGLEDRLSELPDSLIILILSFLPMMDVVRTSMLSKRWKHLWTTTPFLDFFDHRNDFIDYRNEFIDRRNNCVRFHNFVNAFLALWNGTKIIKFNLVYDYNSMNCSQDDLDSWLNLAIEKQVEELHINLITFVDINEIYRGGIYSPPQPFYSSPSITKLSLEFCKLRINGKVQWNQLKSLRIYDYWLSDEVINQILSGCPQLQVLDLRLADTSENLTIHSSSLKKLEIYKFFNMDDIDDVVAMGTVLTIWAPNLEDLHILGCPYGQYSFTDVSSLSNVTLDLSCSCTSSDHQLRPRPEVMTQLFQSIHHVQTLTLSPWCIQVFGLMKREGVFLPLADAEFLNLRGSKLNTIVDVLEMFPKLRVFVVKRVRLCSYVAGKQECEKWSVEHDNSFEYTSDCSRFLVQLRRVEITWIYNDDPIDLFIEFLSKYGCNLEEIVFYQISCKSPYRQWRR